MTTPLPPHGKRARYLRGCRCGPCTRDHVRYCKRHKYQTHVNGPKRVSVQPALDHIRTLTAAGWSWHQIAHVAGCSSRSVGKILNGEQKTISREHSRKILAADPTALKQDRAALVPSIGFLRRGRALVAIGHNNQSIAEALGMNPVVLSRILVHDAPTIKAETAFAMAELYKRWSSTPGTSKRAQTVAAERDWHGPMAWDDIDDPSAQPYADLNVLPPTKQSAERTTEVLLLADAGVLKHEIARRVDISLTRVEEILREHRPVLVRQIKAASDAERGNRLRRSAA